MERALVENGAGEVIVAVAVRQLADAMRSIASQMEDISQTLGGSFGDLLSAEVENTMSSLDSIDTICAERLSFVGTGAVA